MSKTGQSLENEPPSTPQLCMDIVRDYSKDLFSKVFAVKSILAAFDESAAYEDMQQSQVDAVIRRYLAMLDQHDNTQSLAAICGERSGANDQLEEDGDHECTHVSKRHRSESLGAHTSSKKCVPDESLFAWLANDNSNDTALSPNQEFTWKLVQNHMLDLKASKCMVLRAKRVPEFLILSGTMSWQERQSTSTSFSQACTPPSQITELSKTLETSNCHKPSQNC
jgi:hypothetical protein